MGSLPAKTNKPYDNISTAPDRIIDMTWRVKANRSGVEFLLVYERAGALVVDVPFWQLGQILDEFRSASIAMCMGHMRAQRILSDRGLRPRSIDIGIDRETRDRVLTMRFHDYPPLTVRMSPLELAGFLMRAQMMLARAMN